jgi:taurine--2-oxoglutarate transaminase
VHANTGELALKARIVELEQQYVLHSWSKQGSYDSPVVVGGEGSWFFDSDGNRYLDFSSQAMSNNLGHQHPDVVRAIVDQANKLCYAVPSFATEPRALLAQRIADKSPGALTKTLFTTGGAEANENAIKMARFFTGKHKILTRWRSYHGATAGAMTLSGDPRRWAMEPGIPGIVRVLDCYCYRCPFQLSHPECKLRCAEHIGEVIELEGHHTVAAVLVEPVVGSSGIMVPPDGYLERVAEICRANDVLLIFDEVMCGFGRTGTWFACQHWNVAPDIMTLAKGLTAAHIPLGAVVVSAQIAEHFDDRTLYCGLTYSGHALACAAGLAALDAYERHEVIDNARAMGELLGSKLQRIADRHHSVGEIRGLGLFWAVEMVRDRETRERFVAWNQTSPVLTQVAKEAMQKGLFLPVRWNFFMIVPPLIITQEELLHGLEIFDEVLEAADREIGV